MVGVYISLKISASTSPRLSLKRVMATSSCDDLSTTCDHNRSPNLDNKGIHDKNCLQLRRNRSAAKANVMKKIKEVTECMSNSRDVTDVELKAKEFLETATHFRGVHSVYHTPLDDEFRIQDSNDYLDSEAQRIENFQQILDKWFTRANKELYENVDSEIVKPHDPLATLEQDLAHDQISRSPRYMGHVVDH